VAIFRFAFAVTLAMTLAQCIAWPLSFVHPALVVALTSMPGPTLRESLANFGYALAALSIGIVFALFFLAFPLAFLVAFPLILFLTMYFMSKGAPLFFCLFMVIGLALFPLVGTVHDIVSLTLAGSLLFSALTTVLVVQISFGLFRDPGATTSFGAALPDYQPGYSATAARSAAAATLVLTPAVIAFIVLELTGQAVVLIYMFIISVGGNLGSGRYAAQKYLKANTVGGLGAVVFYLCLVVVPEVYFLVPLMLLTALLFGRKICSDDPYAAYYASALTGLVILVSSSLGPGADVDANAVLRILYVWLAGTYAILGFSLADGLAARLIRE
jgi:hypothetical protein